MPQTDAIVATESSYSLEHFLPAAIDATCGGSNGVIALNLSNNNQQVESDLATGRPRSPSSTPRMTRRPMPC